jgi:chromosome partitioning protein
MKRIALVQQKGGAAKTTLCVHLAVAAEQDGRRTAIIDIDPQASASNVWGGARGEKAPPVAAAQDTLVLPRANRVPAAAVMTRAAARTDEEMHETERALAALGLPLLMTRVMERKVYRRALTQGQAVGEFAPSNKAAREIRALWREIDGLDTAKIEMVAQELAQAEAP